MTKQEISNKKDNSKKITCEGGEMFASLEKLYNQVCKMNSNEKGLRHFSIMEEVDENLTIYQYMDLDYLLRLLKKQKYYVKPKKYFSDKHECSLPIKSLFRIAPVGENDNDIKDQTPDDYLIKSRLFRESGNLLTACWTEHNGENVLMWKNFTSKLGVCIKSTIANFIASFKKDNFVICCGRMFYEGIKYHNDNIERLFIKDKAFKGEEEIRFYFIPSDEIDTSKMKGLSIAVDPKVMIDEIILSPYINRIAANELKTFITEKYNVKVNLSQIELSI